MTTNETKKELYKQKLQAIRIGEDEKYLYYQTFLLEGTFPIDFRVPRNEASDEEGNLIFHEQEPAQLLIRYLWSESNNNNNT